MVAYGSGVPSSVSTHPESVTEPFAWCGGSVAYDTMGLVSMSIPIVIYRAKLICNGFLFIFCGFVAAKVGDNSDYHNRKD